MLQKNDYAQFVKNTDAFWHHEFIGRPFISATYPKKNSEQVKSTYSYVGCLRKSQSGDWKDYAEMFKKIAKNNVYAAESVPAFKCDISTDQFAGFFGAKIIGRDGEYTTWAEHISSDDELIFDESEGSYYKNLLEFYKNISEYAGNEYILNVLDSHSNLDGLSALWGPEKLCYMLIDDPERVNHALDKINSAYHKIYNDFYYAGQMDKKGTSSWLPAYSTRRFNVLQCDFSCMISGEMAKEFLFPSLEEELDSLDDSIYHYDGIGALHHIDDILAIKKINCIQWVPGSGNPPTWEWIDLLKKIQQAGKSLWLRGWSTEQILADKELDPSKVLFEVRFKSEEEYLQFMDKLIKKYK